MRRGILPAFAALILAAGSQAAPVMVRTLPVGDATADVVDLDPRQVTLRVLDARDFGARALTASEFAARSGAVAVINASFFDEKGEPLGLLVVDGTIRTPLRPVDWGVFGLKAGAPRILHTRDFADQAFDQAIQSGPRLVVGGTPLKLKVQSARRSAICVAGGRVRLIAVPSSVLASSLADALAADGCVDALNLDGGPSTQLTVRAHGRERVVDGGWPVPIALGVFAADDAVQWARGGCAGCR